jgi:uncharacterized protein (DUF1786 family)
MAHLRNQERRTGARVFGRSSAIEDRQLAGRNLPTSFGRIAFNVHKRHRHRTCNASSTESVSGASIEKHGAPILPLRVGEGRVNARDRLI